MTSGAKARVGIGSENEGNNKKWIKSEMERNWYPGTTTGQCVKEDIIPYHLAVKDQSGVRKIRENAGNGLN